MNTSELKIFSFYKFIKIKNPNEIKSFLDDFCKDKILRGTILLATEGINASISGKERDLQNIIKKIKILLNITDFNIKNNSIKFLPFNKMRVKIKKEIVSLGQHNININKYTGKFVDPKNWNNLILDPGTKVIDVRNEFEIGIGKFINSINPMTESFREFPESLTKMDINKNDTIAMYCTGGIRCEKASAFLKLNGFKNIYQLKGGIINYLDYSKDNDNESLWNGECFVFDSRVTVNEKLNKGKYIQCYGCRRPITKKDTNSNYYKKGVTCPQCYHERSEIQKRNSQVRQTQIDMKKY